MGSHYGALKAPQPAQVVLPRSGLDFHWAPGPNKPISSATAHEHRACCTANRRQPAARARSLVPLSPASATGGPDLGT